MSLNPAPISSSVVGEYSFKFNSPWINWFGRQKYTGTGNNIVTDEAPIINDVSLVNAQIPDLSHPPEYLRLSYSDGGISPPGGAFSLTIRRTQGNSAILTMDGNFTYRGQPLILQSNFVSILDVPSPGVGTIVLATATQILTSKTLTAPVLTTPVLGTPTSGVLTNCTGYTEANLSTSDITTNNSSTSKHGFLKKLDNDPTHFMNGQGNWVAGGTGDALTTNPLSQFAATTSAQLAGVLSDETGTGSAVFANTPTLVTPVLGAATATTINGATIPTVTGTLSLVKISSATASSSASISFTGLSSTYKSYMVVFEDILPATDGSQFYMRTSSNNGSSYDSGASDYSYMEWFSTEVSATPLNFGDFTSTFIALGPGASDNVLPMSGKMDIFSHSTSANPTIVQVLTCGHEATSGDFYAFNTYAKRNTNAVTNAIQFLFSSDNIASGNITLYGVVA